MVGEGPLPVGCEIIKDDLECIRLLTDCGAIHSLQKSMPEGFNQASYAWADDSWYCLAVYHCRQVKAEDNGFVVLRLARSVWSAEAAAAFVQEVSAECRYEWAEVRPVEFEVSKAVNN